MSKKAGPDSDHVVRQAKWAAMKDEFLELSILGKDVHWPSLSAKYGFEPQTARNRASRQRWYAEIEERRKAREDILETKMVERTSIALDQLNQDFATNEVAIRKRHATMARGLQVRAVTRLKEIPLSDFTPRDALAMLKLGLEEERYAMGMPQVFEGAKEIQEHPEFNNLAEQMGGHRKVQEIGTALLKALQSADFAEAAAAHEAGLGPVDVEVKEVKQPPAPPTPLSKPPATPPAKPQTAPTAAPEAVVVATPSPKPAVASTPLPVSAKTVMVRPRSNLTIKRANP